MVYAHLRNSLKRKKGKSEEIDIIKNADVSRIRINLTFGSVLIMS